MMKSLIQFLFISIVLGVPNQVITAFDQIEHLPVQGEPFSALKKTNPEAYRKKVAKLNDARSNKANIKSENEVFTLHKVSKKSDKDYYRYNTVDGEPSANMIKSEFKPLKGNSAPNPKSVKKQDVPDWIHEPGVDLSPDALAQWLNNPYVNSTGECNGCFRGQCWSICDNGWSSHTWCYTSGDFIFSHHYHTCKDASDCAGKECRYCGSTCSNF